MNTSQPGLSPLPPPLTSSPWGSPFPPSDLYTLTSTSPSGDTHTLSTWKSGPGRGEGRAQGEGTAAQSRRRRRGLGRRTGWGRECTEAQGRGCGRERGSQRRELECRAGSRGGGLGGRASGRAGHLLRKLLNTRGDCISCLRSRAARRWNCSSETTGEPAGSAGAPGSIGPCALRALPPPEAGRRSRPGGPAAAQAPVPAAPPLRPASTCGSHPPL